MGVHPAPVAAQKPAGVGEPRQGLPDEVLAALHVLREHGWEPAALPREIIVDRRYPAQRWRGTPADWEVRAHLEYVERLLADPDLRLNLARWTVRRDQLRTDLARRRSLHYARASAPFELGALIERLRALDPIAVLTPRLGGHAHSLRRVGDHYVGLCPLHLEQTPSFVIWESPRPHWRCFGCGESGGNIDAVMALDNLDFVPAVLALAREFHLAPPDTPGPRPWRVE